jgi:hypothetical protein
VLVAQHNLDRKAAEALAVLALREHEPIPLGCRRSWSRPTPPAEPPELTQQTMRRLKSDYESDLERLSGIGDMAVMNKRLISPWNIGYRAPVDPQPRRPQRPGPSMPEQRRRARHHGL